MKPLYALCLQVAMLSTLSAAAQTSFYVNDNSQAGDVFTTAVGSNSNAGSAASPFASLQYAISQASANDIIYVDAGNYVEQVIINKGITIIGAGQSLTFFTPPSTTLVPAPGPFGEIGLFETTQGIEDVHIRNLNINSNGGSQNIIIQTGGSVKNCTLLNGNQCIFFRIPDASSKTAVMENNQLEPVYIGINCQGSGLTALIRSNTITRSAEIYAGIFAGLDFGPLPSFTITNNIINNYAAYGMGILGSSYNGTINSNSFTGAGVAINRANNDGNTLLASCNWFGSTNSATVASKIVGSVNYTPFLTSGTDGSSNGGFQPTVACGTGNSWYVNDNSLAGDVFTSAPGNDANAGTAAAPFATIQYAVNAAAANDIIYLDAGTYTEQVTTTKGISIIGAGQNLTSILIPATTVPPPGPFTEQAVIQTAQNIGDVNIKDLSVTGALTPLTVTPIIIQSGGSVRNCSLQGGNQGLFVRVDAATNPSSKTFVVEGNIIDAEYIAVNFEGANIIATLNNNTLSANNPGFSAGMFANANRITATKNLFNKYFSYGILVASANPSITQNAFNGTGAFAIYRSGGANVTANCNWFGTANVSAIVSKVTAGVNYYPWYMDGTDQNTVAGFQHTTEGCGASNNTYYVNDNSPTGDLFTAAVGNDANPGTPTAPLATVGAAIAKASPGAAIYVDAGTYAAQNITIGKQVQIIGTNYSISPNSPSDPLLPNASRKPETIIENSNWIIGADGISITGMTLNPLSNNAIVMNNNAFGNINISRNRIRLNSIFPALVFAGTGTTTMGVSGIANWGITITENRFEKEDASSGNSVRINRFGSVSINNNSFVVTGATERTQNSLVFGNAGIVAYLFVNNNVFDKTASAINANSLGYTQIGDNKFSNSNFAFNGNNPLSESSDVFFNNNTITSSNGAIPFVQYTRQGGNLAGSSSSFTAENNTISVSAVAGTTTLAGGMNLTFTNSVLNQSLTIRNNKMAYNGDFSTVEGQYIRPLMLRGNLKNALVEKNEIALSGSNLQPANPAIALPVSPAITLYTEGFTTAFLQPGNVINILNNKVSGFKHSVAVYDPIAGNSSYVGFGNLPSGVTVNINNNSFTGDSISINNGSIGETVNANCNWYGSAAAQNLVNRISNANAIPWLTNGTDIDPATGFQPAGGSCNGYPTLIVLDSSRNITCNGAANGSIYVTASYGKSPVTYTWTKDEDPNFVSNQEDPTGLTPGTYRLTIVDGNGSNIYITNPQADAPDTIVVTITEPDLLTATPSGTNNVCYNGTIGTASVVADGGTAPYTYQWSNNATTDEITGLAAGVYTATVTDAHGCTATASYEVTQPTPVTATIANNSTACSNIATVNATGGTQGYTYLWSNGATSATIGGVPVGTYGVTVTDANGCTGNASINLTVTEAFNPSANATNVTCFGANNGIITVTNANGTAPFQFSKDGGVTYVSGTLPFSFSNLAAGTYNIAVKDVNGCTGFVQRTVTQPTALTPVISSVVSACFGQSNGAVTVTVTGGTPAYSYSWSKQGGGFSSTQLNINGVAAGNYTLTVTDKNGCVAVLPVSVPSNNEILVITAVTNVLCRNTATGAINLTVTGGTGTGFSYSWTGAVTATSEDLNNISAANNYNVRITDIGSGCFVDRTYAITQPTALTISTAGTNATGCNSLGSITATAGGGAGNYQYSLNGGAYQTSNVFTGLYAGTYTISVRDGNGCVTAAAPRTITDNGSDQYESNNSRTNAKTISFGTTINARLAVATDVADWFVVTTPAGSSAQTYSLVITHPTPGISYNFHLFPASPNNADTIQPILVVGNTQKNYRLAPGTAYRIGVTTSTLSFVCYSLGLGPEVAPITRASFSSVKVDANTLTASSILRSEVAPNPHQGSFTLRIESPETGLGVVEMYNAAGQKLNEREVNLVKGKNNQVQYTQMNQKVILYRVRIGKHAANGKIIGLF